MNFIGKYFEEAFNQEIDFELGGVCSQQIAAEIAFEESDAPKTNYLQESKNMTTAKRTRTKGVKGTRPNKEKKEVNMSKYVNYIEDGDSIDVPDNFLDFVFLLYGESGSGKTSTLAQAPGAYVIQCDPNRRGLKIRQTNIPNDSLATIKKPRRSIPTPWQIIVATVDTILADRSVKTIIFDNFKIMYEHASNHYCKVNRVDSLSEMEDYGKSWNLVDSMYMDLFARIVDSGRGLGLITHQKEVEEELPSGRMYTQIRPDLSGRPFQAVRAMTDFVFYLGKNSKSERELTIRHDTNDIFYKCCTDESNPHFFTPEGKPVKRIAMGNSPQQGWKNWMKSWDNNMPCAAPVRKPLKKRTKKKTKKTT